jgi:hypothetical protein
MTNDNRNSSVQNCTNEIVELFSIEVLTYSTDGNATQVCQKFGLA